MSIATTNRPPGSTVTVARSAPRRRSLMQGALAVLLIVAGALTAGYVAQRIGTTHNYLAVARPVGAGQEITSADLLVVRINSALGLRPVPSDRADEIVGKHAVMALVPGSLITLDQVTDNPVPKPGFQIIGLRLKEGMLPQERLDVGASVVLVVIPDKTLPTAETPAIDLTPPRTFAGTVVDVQPGNTEGDTLVNVEITTADAPAAAALSADDRIAVALASA
jgi:SAF domain